MSQLLAPPRLSSPDDDVFVEVRSRTGALLARYDPTTQRLEVRRNGHTEIVDLRRYQQEVWVRKGCVADELS